MRILTALIIFISGAAQAGTVFTYGWPDGDSDTDVLRIEIQNGKLRWQWDETEWNIFDQATGRLIEHAGETDDDYARTFLVLPAVAEAPVSTPEELGFTERAGYDCTLYAYGEPGFREKTCLASAETLGINKNDYMTLLSLYSALHRLRDHSEEAPGDFPSGFEGVAGVAVWQRGSSRLIKVETRNIPAERFVTPPGYDALEKRQETLAPDDIGW